MSSEKRQPRPFQLEVLKLIARGKNVILQAPTGAGKTDAALLPFIQNLEQGGHTLPYTCLYATPMRVLSTQFYEKYRTRIANIDKVRGTTLAKPYEYIKRSPISIQTGEQQDDPQFESILTFCTIDQLLASFLGIPYSVDSRRANINVGAVISSYLVLDEFHLYPLVQKQNDTTCFGARTTTISMLRLLQSTTRFILMTATFSNTLLNYLAKLLDAEIVPITHEDLNLISNGRERIFEIASSGMSVDAILDNHDKCSLVICNTVQRAQEMYWKLKDRARGLGIEEVVLLHSRLTSADRTFRSGYIMHELAQAPKQWDSDLPYGWKNGTYYGKNIIVVATQVVEVGLDISVQTLHTELAPANSLIQRAGRCARFVRQKGRVIVYPLQDSERREFSSRPYDKRICDKTWEVLHDVDKCLVSFKEERELIDAVHTEEDKSLLERYGTNHGHITKNIFTSLNENKRGIATSLIRDVAQVHILIHDDPDEAIKEAPWRWQSFALHPKSLAGRWEALQKRAADLDLRWVCKQAIAIEVNDAAENDPDADNRLKTQYKWVEIPSSGKFDTIAAILRDALMVVLPGKLATYHEELGFILLDSDLNIGESSYESILEESKGRKRESEPLKHQSYLEHISGLVEAYDRSIKTNLQYVIYQLEELMGLSPDLIDQSIRLAIACHDIGKLGQQWQQWAWDWQTLLFKEKGWPALPDQSYFFAKTDFDYQSPEHKMLRGKMALKRPPHHACEGAALSMELIAASLGIKEEDDTKEKLLRAVCGAIAHHHTANAHEYGSIRLKQGAIAIVKDALERAKELATWTYDLSPLEETPELESDDLAPANAHALITRPKQGSLDEPETWLYFVIVRALRLADQRAGKFV